MLIRQLLADGIMLLCKLLTNTGMLFSELIAN